MVETTTFRPSLQTRGQDAAGDCVAPQLSLACQAAPLMAIYYFLTPVNGRLKTTEFQMLFSACLPILNLSLTPVNLHPFNLLDMLFRLFRNLILETSLSEKYVATLKLRPVKLSLCKKKNAAKGRKGNGQGNV